MKLVDRTTYITIGELAKLLNRSTVTIKFWKSWYDQQPLDIQQEYPLPEFRRDLDKRGTRFVDQSLLPKFQSFRDAMVYGKMALCERQKRVLGGD